MYANALNTTLREIHGIGLTTTECTRIDTDHMADEEGIARPERFELPITWFEAKRLFHEFSRYITSLQIRHGP